MRLVSTNLMVPKRDNWRWVMRELTAELDVQYWLESRTKSGNWLVAVSSQRQTHLDKVLERAIAKLG